MYVLSKYRGPRFPSQQYWHHILALSNLNCTVIPSLLAVNGSGKKPWYQIVLKYGYYLQKAHMTDETKISLGKQYFTKNTGSVYEFYLSGEIEEASEYCDWFDTIRNARANDTVKIYINSCGGDLYTALQFLRVLSETDAHVITSVEGACMSAATMIFLHGDEFEVTPHSLFMFHNYSAGVFGKGGEMFDQLQFERAWSENFLREVYHDFLTPDEIKSMLDNKDIWMTSQQVLTRIDLVLAKMAALEEVNEESMAAVE